MSETMYLSVAQEFADAIRTHFATEETLEALAMKDGRFQKFDRTDNWNYILRNLLRAIWAANPETVGVSMADRDEHIILHLLVDLLDYNLFSQVLLNLQTYGLLSYRHVEATLIRKALTDKYKDSKDSPFAPKAKMYKAAANEKEMEFNQDLSKLKALNIVAGFTPSISFRVSPMGATPALVDSKNLSSLGSGGDELLRTPDGYRISYITWDQAPPVALPQPDNTFAALELPYKFKSNSGGEILNSVLFSRCLATDIYRIIPGVLVVPRMSSLLLIYPTTSRDAYEKCKATPHTFGFSGFTFHDDVRKG